MDNQAYIQHLQQKITDGSILNHEQIKQAIKNDMIKAVIIMNMALIM